MKEFFIFSVVYYPTTTVQIRSLDSNKDNRISLIEFVECNLPKKIYESATALFHEIDTNNDNYITKCELDDFIS